MQGQAAVEDLHEINAYPIRKYTDGIGQYSCPRFRAVKNPSCCDNYAWRGPSRYKNGQDRLKVIKLVLWDRSHTLEGAALCVWCFVCGAIKTQQELGAQSLFGSLQAYMD